MKKIILIGMLGFLVLPIYASNTEHKPDRMKSMEKREARDNNIYVNHKLEYLKASALCAFIVCKSCEMFAQNTPGSFFCQSPERLQLVKTQRSLQQKKVKGFSCCCLLDETEES